MPFTMFNIAFSLSSFVLGSVLLAFGLYGIKMDFKQKSNRTWDIILILAASVISSMGIYLLIK